MGYLTIYHTQKRTLYNMNENTDGDTKSNTTRKEEFLLYKEKQQMRFYHLYFSLTSIFCQCFLVFLH